MLHSRYTITNMEVFGLLFRHRRSLFAEKPYPVSSSRFDQFNMSLSTLDDIAANLVWTNTIATGIESSYFAVLQRKKTYQYVED